MATIEVNVENIENPLRLDVYISSLSNGIPRSQLKTGLQSVKINGKDAKLSKNVKNGDFIQIEWNAPVPSCIEPQDIPLDVVYEDENVTVVNKKQGMVTHPASGNWDSTLVNALLFHWGKEKQSFEKDNLSTLRPGIVHRLDKDTSGSLITAKNYESELWLQNQFQNRRVKKEYIAIVMNRPKEAHGSIKTGIVRDSKNRKKFTWTDVDKGKFAHTQYRCIAMFGPYSLMKVKIKTGRTHQIRVHMKYLGCPILGDSVYGKKDSLFSSATLMLHSYKLGIRLPNSDEFTEFTSPVPRRFKKVLKTLHEKFEKEKFRYGR